MSHVFFPRLRFRPRAVLLACGMYARTHGDGMWHADAVCRIPHPHPHTVRIPYAHGMRHAACGILRAAHAAYPIPHTPLLLLPPPP
eukprot:2095491-Pyramimonas_sp.AAC.1